ncbi:MAG: VacB/RNase II family 3'-5' exoribonuclease [Candidatus Zambryskibacteria bacterium]|nr:VacB/RNase II family 3'-5' exoribonuclease [Candidatus Zambryskibacteria bacterium]
MSKKENRKDFRDVLTFTIDPIDSKDFDDALSYEKIDENILRIGVHIADVSYFVKPGTVLDRKARKKAFSTYLVGKVIPMLPEELSNDLCSLKPNVDRLAFSVVFDIEKKTGKILKKWFGKTVINSDKRFSYEEAQEALESRITNYELWKKNYGKELEDLNRIANIYRAENKKNGAIEFETNEVQFELDKNGKPLKIYKKPRLDTMKMIEEWMLLANREVARFISDRLKKSGGSSIFRVHDLPDMEKIQELAIFVRALGHELPISNGNITAKDLNLLLSKIEGHASESIIRTAALRSMAKAEYSTNNIGHFGLAFEYYTHFTSPIRRYPDLMVHRILEKLLNNEKISSKEFSSFSKIAREASEKEIEVQEAERESIKQKQVEYMQDKIGQEFDCVISGVTEWGIYVEDLKTRCEGLVHVRSLGNDYYELDQKNYCLVGKRTGVKYTLGNRVRVRLVSVDSERGYLNFKLIP